MNNEDNVTIPEVPEILPPIVCLPWPLPEPPLDPEHFHDEIDWSTFSPEELYRMATTGLDLEGANEVAAEWSRLGAELDDIGAELRRMLDVAADAWQGEAAEQTRDTLQRLVAWTEETADASNRVCGCVTEQAGLAARTAHEMPPPPPRKPPFFGPPASGTPVFALGAEFVEDPASERDRITTAHHHAAEVMRRYQEQSRDVYTRVPTFPDPAPDMGVKRTPDEPEREDSPEDTTTASAVVGGGIQGLAGGVAAPGSSPGTYSGSGTGGTPGGQAAQGLGTGAGQVVASSTPAVSGAVGGRGATGMGAMPMAGMGARRKEEDIEHRRPSYLEEDEDLWHGQTLPTPPVIGEEPRHGGRF